MPCAATQPENDRCTVNPPSGGTCNSQSHRDRKKVEGWLQSCRREGTNNDLFRRYSMTILEEEKNSGGSLDNSVNALGATELQNYNDGRDSVFCALFILL